jgi:hypothetical protein
MSAGRARSRHWADPVPREEPGADRAAAARPGRDQGGRVPGGAAAQRIAGGQAARGHTAGERTGGKKLRDLKGMPGLGSRPVGAMESALRDFAASRLYAPSGLPRGIDLPSPGVFELPSIMAEENWGRHLKLYRAGNLCTCDFARSCDEKSLG